MVTEPTVEQQIQAEIESLRIKYPQTQDLYREACVLLFFRFGVTPTANKLYQFVRKGSMSAPAEALAKFWEALREKSRVRVEHPDLPDELRTAAGELTAVLWAKAQASAQEGLIVFRGEAQAAVLEAQTARIAAEADRDTADREANETRASLIEAGDRVRALEQQLAAERATRAALETQIKQAGQDAERLQAALEEARHDFGAELEKHRASAQLAEERFGAAEKRALLEIDHERTVAAKHQKDIELTRNQANQAAQRHETTMLALHAELGQVRQQAGLIEGKLHAAASECDRLTAEAQSLRLQLTEAVGQAAGFRSEADSWRQRAEEAQRVIVELQDKPVRHRRQRSAKDSGEKSL